MERTGSAGTHLTCTGDMASRLLVLGARPLGMTPGGGWRALFITLLQLATMVRMVSDSSWVTLLEQRDISVNKQPLALSRTGWMSTRPGPGYTGPSTSLSRTTHPAQDCRQASMVAKVSGGSWELLGWSLSGGSPPIIEGQRLFRNVTHAWMKGSFMGEKQIFKKNRSKRV